MQSESSVEVVSRYLRDAIDFEKQFAQQLLAYAKEGDNPDVETWLRDGAAASTHRIADLSARLQTLDPHSHEETILKRVFHGLSGRHFTVGQEYGDRISRKLTGAFAATQSMRALYESLANIAEAAGEAETAALAHRLELEESTQTARILELLKAAARREFDQLTQ